MFGYSTSRRLRKYWKIPSKSYYLQRTALCSAESPRDDTPFFKTDIEYNFGARDHICGPIIIFYDILDSGEQMSVFKRLV